jgi:hypothetical protein
MEHTHLVKGLDYALLEKTRRQKEKEDELARVAEAAKADILSLDQIEPTTAIGAEVLRGLRKLQLLEQRTTGPHSAGSILRRTAYDFDIRPDSEVDVPLLVTRSKTVSCSCRDSVSSMCSLKHKLLLRTVLQLHRTTPDTPFFSPSPTGVGRQRRVRKLHARQRRDDSAGNIAGIRETVDGQTETQENAKRGGREGCSGTEGEGKVRAECLSGQCMTISCVRMWSNCFGHLHDMLCTSCGNNSPRLLTTAVQPKQAQCRAVAVRPG